MRRKPGTDTKFPAQFAGNWLSVPGLAPRVTPLRGLVSAKPLITPEATARPAPRAGKIARVAPQPNLDTRTEMGPATHPAWRRVQLARHPKRPHSLDYIGRIFTDFQEFHGDRAFGDDPAIVAGAALFAGRPVMLVAEQKGRDTKQRFYRNFGMPKPEGYRKALRIMQLAAKFGRPDRKSTRLNSSH